MKQLVIFTLVLCTSVHVFSDSKRFRIFKENSTKRAIITNNKPISMFYENAAWNQNNISIDAGFLYLRDQKTGNIAELKLTETEPNSGVFSMELSIGSLKSKKIAAEIYSAPLSMLIGKDRLKVIKGLIKDNNIKRKPFLLRVLRKKGQIIDVFENKESAVAAYDKYKKLLGLDKTESQSVIQVKNQDVVEKKKVIDTSTLQSLFMANENNLANDNAKNSELRSVLMEVEKKRRNKVVSDGKAWSSSTLNANAEKGKKKIKKAVNQTKDKNFKAAVDSFYESSNLIPSNEDAYEQYGVGLHKAGKYNQSIVVLSLAKNSSSREAEKQFYLGMNYYKLKDFDNAIKHFDAVMKMKDKTFGATAAFYKGSSLIELKKFEESKESFQYVLDNSDNPDMDAKAEKYIEASLDLQALEKKRSNKHFFDGVLGLMYDSNIILATNDALLDNTVQGEGWRFLVQGGYKYRPYYSESDEIAVTLDVTALRSTDESFGSNPDGEKADPYVINLSVPWTHRGTLGGKGFFFDLVPGYETILMDLDGNSNKAIINSLKIDMNNTLVVNKNWIAKGDWSFSSNDASILGDETGADSFGARLRLSSIFILNKDLERYLIPEFAYSINDADDGAYAYSRSDIAVSYTSSIFDMFLWNSRFGYFIANYKNDRTDNNYSFSSGLSYHINPHWDYGLTVAYTINDSNTNAYDKYTILNSFSFSY